MNKTEYNRYRATKYRENHREAYNEYCNKWYHENNEKQKEYKREWRRKKIEEARQQGIINLWGYVNRGEKPIYGEKNE